MARFSLTILAVMALVIPSLARSTDESCPVAGLTTRWAMSYCMTRFETDDEAHPQVSDCFLKELRYKLANGPDEDCDANVAYKSAMCSILIEFGLYEESLASCVASDEMIPSVVTDGVG